VMGPSAAYLLLVPTWHGLRRQLGVPETFLNAKAVESAAIGASN